MKIPDSRPLQFLIFAACEFVAFFVLVANTRAYTKGLYGWTAATDMFFCAQLWTQNKVMTEDKNARTWAAGLGTTIGGACGSLFAIWITKHVYGE